MIDCLRLRQILALRDLIIGVPLDFIIQVGNLLGAVEDGLAHASFGVRVDRDLQLVTAHVAHSVKSLISSHRCLRNWLIEVMAVLITLRYLTEPGVLLPRVVNLKRG